MDTKIRDIYGVKQAKNLYNSGSSYLATNDAVSNFIFVIVVLVVTIIIFQMIVGWIINVLTPSNNPHLIDGMVELLHFVPVNKKKV